MIERLATWYGCATTWAIMKMSGPGVMPCGLVTKDDSCLPTRKHRPSFKRKQRVQQLAQCHNISAWCAKTDPLVMPQFEDEAANVLLTWTAPASPPDLLIRIHVMYIALCLGSACPAFQPGGAICKPLLCILLVSGPQVLKTLLYSLQQERDHFPAAFKQLVNS